MNSLLAVFRFECKRIITPGRSVWWLLVAIFPMVITMLMGSLVPTPRTSARNQMQEIPITAPDGSTIVVQQMPDGRYVHIESGQEWESPRRRRGARSGPPQLTQQNIDTIYTIVLYFLAPSIACMLGCLLTAAPSVASELEQHSWIYIATRPNGLFHLVIGKYLVAVLWAVSATVTGVLLALPFSRIAGMWDAAWPLVSLAILSACCYSALYMTIGTLFPQRAMVFCVAYTAGVELFMGMFPAVISRFTIQYRLRSLLFHWIPKSEDFDNNQDLSSVMQYVASGESVFLQLAWLLTFAAVMMAVALTTVQVREFTTAKESDV